jgi:hypothetical protein
MDKQLELLTFFNQLGKDVSDLQMHNPSTTGVHSTDDENFDYDLEDSIAVDDEVPYTQYLDEPANDEAEVNPDGNNVMAPDPDVELDSDFNDFDNPFDNNLDPLQR